VVVGKGKAPVVACNSSKPAGQSKPRSSFMEAARRPSTSQADGARARSRRDGGHRSLVRQPQPNAAEAGRRAPVFKSVLAPESRLLGARFTAPDSDGWQLVVRKRKRKPSCKKSRPSRGRAGKVPTHLRASFNCFCNQHVFKKSFATVFLGT
jgi:hypothetical protein